MNFHGPYTENILNINYRETDHPAAARAEHGDTIHEQIRETLHSQQPPYFFAMIYVNQQIQRPTFAYICPDSVLHPVRIRCHILQPDKATNYLCGPSKSLLHTSQPVSMYWNAYTAC